MQTVIFNIQFDYQGGGGSGSSLRPVMMRDAFVRAGYRIIDIVGHRRDRAARVNAVIAELPSLSPSTTLLYAESATFPHYFDLPSRSPWFSPDLKLARAAASFGIPTGLFYRDMHWRFLQSGTRRMRWIQAVYRPFYKRELREYIRTYSVLFGPTEDFLNSIPGSVKANCVPLPPGAPSFCSSRQVSRGKKLIHVGGLTAGRGLYDVRPLLEGVKDTPWFVELICRKPEFAAVRGQYGPALDGCSIRHLSGAQKSEALMQAAIGLMVYTPHQYRELAFPVKMLEYLAHGLPIVVSGPSAASRFVLRHEVGWEVSPTAGEVRGLLNRLANHPEEVEAARRRIPEVLHEHSWSKRVEQVETALGK